MCRVFSELVKFCVTTIGVCVFQCVQLRLHTLFLFYGEIFSLSLLMEFFKIQVSVLGRRKKNILCSIIALIAGGLIYMFFRPDTHIGNIFHQQNLAQLIPIGNFGRFHLPDFLWGLSLSCCLVAVNNPQFKGVILCSAISFLCGCIWELLQYLEIIRGTGDLYDVIMYFLSSALCIIINLKEKEQ